MEISQLTIKLIILLIPGGIGAIILERLTVHKPWSSFRFILNTIIIGFCSYAFLQFIISTWCFVHCKIDVFPYYWDQRHTHTLQIWNSINDNNPIPYNEAIKAILISVAIGLILTKSDTYKWLNSFAKKYKISNKYGDENLFSYFLNSSDTQYVYLRDIKRNFTYVGFVTSFSENDDIKEIVLSDVRVYRYEDSEHLYDVDRIYLSLPKDEVIIEYAKVENNGQQEIKIE